MPDWSAKIVRLTSPKGPPVDIDIKVQWHSPEVCFAAVLMRDGEPWHLEGCLVGMGNMPTDAVDALLREAQHLVIYGENFLLAGDQLALEDRVWLFKLLDQGNIASESQEMYLAVRVACGNRDPYTLSPEELKQAYREMWRTELPSQDNREMWRKDD